MAKQTQVLPDSEAATRQGIMDYLEGALRDVVDDGSLDAAWEAAWQATTAPFAVLGPKPHNAPEKSPKLSRCTSICFFGLADDLDDIMCESRVIYDFNGGQAWGLCNEADDKAELITRVIRNRLKEGFEIYRMENVRYKTLKAVFTAMGVKQVKGLMGFINGIKLVHQILGPEAGGMGAVIHHRSINFRINKKPVATLYSDQLRIATARGYGRKYFRLDDEVGIRKALLRRLKGINKV